jgi:predicted ATPase
MYAGGIAMKLRRFRLKGYRCVEDSGIVHLATDVTILAGKNESGKSAIFDGISFFMTDQGSLPFNDKTQGYDGPSQLWAEFELNEHDVSYFSELLDFSIQTRIVHVEYEQEGNVTVSGPALEDMMAHLNQRIQENDAALSKVLGRILARETEDTEGEVDHSEADKLEQEDEDDSLDGDHGRDGLVDQGLAIHNVLRDDEYTSERLCQLLERAEDLPEDSLDDPELWELSRERSQLKELVDNLQESIIECIPPVIHFRSFEDELPDFISLDEDEELPDIVRDFCVLSRLDIDGLKASTNPQERKYIAEEATKVYSKDFVRFWRQEDLEVGVYVDGSNLAFQVKGDEPHSYAPSQRSKGLKWYTSFFIALNARGKNLDSAIVMIDEPGLYLHASAQTDLLCLLEEMAGGDYQILIATHSPYLLSAERLDRVRPVYRSQHTKRTIVRNAWYLLPQIDGNSEKEIRETLTPLITVMGLDVAKGFPGISHALNIIVEGPTDYFYLAAMNQVLKESFRSALPSDVAFLPCFGHANAGLLLSILVGWGLDCVVVLDKKDSKATKKLLIKQGYPESKLIRVGSDENASTVDLFSAQDVKKFILPSDFQFRAGEKASTVLKRVPDVSETILARRFFDRVVSGEQLDLTQTTLDAFEKLFRQISDAAGGIHVVDEVASGSE